MRLYHYSPARNRYSIASHGLRLTRRRNRRQCLHATSDMCDRALRQHVAALHGVQEDELDVWAFAAPTSSWAWQRRIWIVPVRVLPIQLDLIVMGRTDDES